MHRETFLEISLRVEYSLTDLGDTLKEALTPLCKWGTKHMERIGAIHRPCATEAQEGT